MARLPSSISRSFATQEPLRSHRRAALGRLASRELPGAAGDDSDVLAAETAQRMLAENPGATMASVPDCGHSITLDNPDGHVRGRESLAGGGRGWTGGVGLKASA